LFYQTASKLNTSPRGEDSPNLVTLLEPQEKSECRVHALSVQLGPSSKAKKMAGKKWRETAFKNGAFSLSE
jgi:hypothetical protein